MARKLIVGCRNLYKGRAVAREGLLTWFYELRDYLSRLNICLQTYCDSGLPCDSRYVYANKANKEIRHRSEQAGETVTKTPTCNRRTRNPVGQSHVIPTRVHMPAVTQSAEDLAVFKGKVPYAFATYVWRCRGRRLIVGTCEWPQVPRLQPVGSCQIPTVLSWSVHGDDREPCHKGRGIDTIGLDSLAAAIKAAKLITNSAFWPK